MNPVTGGPAPAKLKKSGRPPCLPNKLTNADCGFWTHQKKLTVGPDIVLSTFYLRPSTRGYSHSRRKHLFTSFLALITPANFISYAISVGAFGSCAIAVSNIFAAFLQAAAQFPGRQDDLWTFTLIGVALVETFFFVTILIIVLIFTA